MATVVKNFKVKSGLVVEGTTGTINNFDILTKKADDQTYITNLVGGTGTHLNTPDTLVKRDGSGNFAAGTITAALTGNVTGTVSDISNHDTDDLAEGATNKYYSTTQAKTDAAALLTSATLTNIQITGDGTGLTITAENGVADSTTDDLDEGTSNLYFTDTRARNAVSAGDGLDYNSGTGVFSADLGNGLTIDGSGQIAIDDTVVATDTDVATAVGDHSDLTTGVHGVTGNVVGTDDIQTLENKTLGTGTVLSANLDADGFTVTGLGTPQNASDAATKGYVDSVAEGLHVHASVAAATAGNITLAPAPASVDGVTLTSEMRVLVRAQSAPAENGIYRFDGTNLVRAEDYNTAAEIDAGDFVFVVGGNTYGKTGWVQENNIVTLGTDPIAWSQFSGAGEYSAGNGLTLVGTEFAIDTDITATKTYVDGEIDTHELVSSGIHGITGSFVGTTDTQTLTNKTLGSDTALGADLDGVNTYKIINLVDPTANQDAATKAYVDTEIGNIETSVDNLTTADVAEDPSALYFTTDRAEDAAGNLLANATLTNIQVSYNSSTNALSITAENGVADSTTDNLAEGTTNKYYTDQRVDDYINASIDTDDISEGTSNKYFTEQRVYDSLSGGDGISFNSSTGDISADLGSGLTIAAGEIVVDTTTIATKQYVDDQTTTDVAEGTNLYFTDDRAKDAAGAALTGGSHTNVSVSYDNISKTISLTGAVTYTDEDALDAVGDALVAGSNIAITPDDGADTITVALVDDVVIPTTGSLEVESNDFNVGSQSVGLRTSDGYTNAMAVFSVDADDDYAQLVVKNTGNGVNSSSDVIAYANNGDDASGWIDMGITSSTFNDPSFTITGGNDGYIFMEAPSGTSGDGNLVLATGSNGATNAIVFAAGGLSSDNTQMTITPDESVRIVIPTASTSPTTGALVVDGGVGIQGDVNIQGTITFGGSGTTVTTDNLAVQEPVIYLADGNTTDNLDMGLVAEYVNNGTKYAGIVRDATDGVFKLFANATTKPTNTVNFAEAGLEYGDLKADAIEAASATFTNINIGGIVDQTEIGYLNGVTSSVQTQLDAKLPKSGGSMTGAIAMGTNAITGLANPTNAQDAATKAYVDGEISTVNGTIGALDTDDISEGSNLYFTDARAVTALEAVVPNFTEVDINSVATQVAATASATGSTVNTVYSFAKASYRSAKFLVKVAYGTHTEVSEVLLTLDSTDNIAITEYAVVGTNGSLSTISAEVSGGNVNLTVNPTNTSTVKVFGTLIA